MNITIVDQTSLIAFWLIFSRTLTVLIQLPIFDGIRVPQLVKVLTSIVVSYAFFPFVKAEMIKDIVYWGTSSFWILTVFNVVIGLAIGFIVKSILALFIGAGALMTQQAGFGAIRYFDPSSASQVGPFEQLIQWTVVVIVISSGALLPMFKGVFLSFFSIHSYQLGKFASSPEFFMGFFKTLFTSAIMLASPLIFTNVLIMAVLGIIARIVPQMNVLMVSFVVNIGLGLLVFIATSGEFFNVAYKMYADLLGQWFQLIT